MFVSAQLFNIGINHTRIQTIFFLKLTSSRCKFRSEDMFFNKQSAFPMGTNCASELADLILYSYEADFIPELLTKKEKKLAVSFNFNFFYVIDIFSLNISEQGDYL